MKTVPLKRLIEVLNFQNAAAVYIYDRKKDKKGNVVIEGVEFINNEVTDVVSYKPPNISQWWNKVHKIDKNNYRTKIVCILFFY